MSSLPQPVLETERLLLRPFQLSDAAAVCTLAGDVDVARNTLNIPHPYAEDDALSWISNQDRLLERREAVTYAVTLRREARDVVGAVGLILDLPHERAELGYWVGRPWWGRGYATEAARAVVRWGFHHLDLHRIHASHFPRNPASGRVLRKLGMRHEGCFREHVIKWGERLDLELFGMLREELPFSDARGVDEPPALP